jgi:hypothetical protein
LYLYVAPERGFVKAFYKAGHLSKRHSPLNFLL